MQRLAGTLTSSAVQPVGQHHGIHRACAGTADAVDLQPLLFQQPIQHTPGQGTMRAAALQGEIDMLAFFLGHAISRWFSYCIAV